MGESRHAAANVGYLGVLGLGLAGWFIRGKGTGKVGFLACHVLLPLTLVIGIRHASGTPFIWLWRFAPDATTAIGFSAANMIASGVGEALRTRTPHGRRGRAG